MKSTFSRARRGRTRVILTAGIAAVALALSACSGGSSGGAEGGTLTVLHRWSDPASAPAIKAVFDSFTESTGIDVNSQSKPGDGSTYQPAVRTAMSSSNPPSLATDISGPEVFNFAKAGVAMDLTSFYNSTLKSRSLAGATTGGMYDDKVYAISAGLFVGNLIWYNPVYLEKYGVDAGSIRSYQDLIAAMQKIKDAGGNAAVLGAKSLAPGGHWLNDLVQRALGSTAATALYNRSVLGGQPDTPKWTDPAVVQALQYYVDMKPLFQDGFLGEDKPTADSLFLSGDYGFYEMGSWFLSTIKATPPSFTPGVMLFPSIDGAPGKNSEITIANTVLLASKTANTADVERFLDYFTQPDVVAAWESSTLTFMPYQSTPAASDVDPAIQSQWDQIKGYVDNAGPDGAALFNDQAMDVNIYTKYIWQGSVGLMSGDVSPEELAKQLEAATVAAQQANG